MKLRELLKIETKVQHERLESRLNLMRDGFDRADYIRLLERFYGYYSPCEEQIESCPHELRVVLAGRLKTPLLFADLQQLGHTEQSLAALPRCSVSVMRTTPEALGRWYVLEGSTLGSQFLCRHFEKTLPTVKSALSFFRSYGDDVGAKWRDYCQLLDEHSSDQTDPLALRAAQQTFDDLTGWLV